MLQSVGSSRQVRVGRRDRGRGVGPALALALGIVAMVAACAPAAPASGTAAPATVVPGDAPPSPTSPPASTAPSPSATRSGSPAPYEVVALTASDGRPLTGRLWSTGSVGVVLAHGFSVSLAQATWNRFAPFLRDEAYGVLTFNFRGFCDTTGCSEGTRQLEENWRDVAAAVEYLRSRGSDQIFIIGGSMGGIAAFRAADEADLDIAGLVSLSTPQFPGRYYGDGLGFPEDDVTPERLQRIEAPKLFIAGTDDVQLPGDIPMRPGIESVRFADDAQAMYDAAPEPRQIELIDAADHSANLVTVADPQIVEHTRQIIVAFIEEHR